MAYKSYRTHRICLWLPGYCNADRARWKRTISQGWRPVLAPRNLPCFAGSSPNLVSTSYPHSEICVRTWNFSIFRWQVNLFLRSAESVFLPPQQQQLTFGQKLHFMSNKRYSYHWGKPRDDVIRNVDEIQMWLIFHSLSFHVHCVHQPWSKNTWENFYWNWTNKDFYFSCYYSLSDTVQQLLI